MKPSLATQLAHFQEPTRLRLLSAIKRGLEKESLRITPDGYLAGNRHPEALGSALTHPHITTDYSEALMEFITPPTTELNGPLTFLRDIHRFVYRHLDDQILWGTSMPCMLTKEEDVPIAYYGTSNTAKMKYIYRVGLGHRYGRYMQTIAGVHYNFSYPEAFWQSYQSLQGDSQPLKDFISEQYYGLIRNYLRVVWTVPYLFGASPALCACFVKGSDSGLTPLSPGTLHAPFGTSLRLGDLGYQNKAQADLHVSYNSLAEYTQGLEDAIRTPDPAYAQLGVKNAQGEYQQLSDKVLQIENEYYAALRPKRIGKQGERPALALQRYGVEYLEVRTLDLNPYCPGGVDPDSLVFLDCLLLYCLFADSPLMTAEEQARNAANTQAVVNRGREPGLMLESAEGPRRLQDWGLSLIERLQDFAALLDSVYGVSRFSECLTRQAEKFRDPALTPSARLLADVKNSDLSFFAYARRLSEGHKQTLLGETPERQAQFEQQARESLQQQAQMEASDSLSFEDYLAAYYA